MVKFKDLLLESLDEIEEAVTAPFVGQMLNSIGKEDGAGFQVTFVNDKIVKLKGPKGEKTMTRAQFENEFSLGGEAANESVELEDEEVVEEKECGCEGDCDCEESKV